MSDNDPAARAYRFLQDAMFKWAWGESWDVCDPSDLLDYLIPAVGEALQAIDDPNEAARILLGTHDKQGPEGPEAMSLLLRAALSHASRPGRDACTSAVEQGGAAVIELLVEEFAEDVDELHDDSLLVRTCRSAVIGLPDLPRKLDLLRTAYDRVLKMGSDPAVVEILCTGQVADAENQGDQGVEVLLDHYFEAALVDDPLPFFGELIDGLKTARGSVETDPSGREILMGALGEVVSTEGVRFLWEYYQEYLGWDGGLDEAAVLVKMYEQAVCAVTDVKWLADRVLEACESIASADNDISAWLPDREQLSKACVDAIKAAGEPIATRDAMQRPFWLAVKGADEPWDVMADTFRNVTNRVEILYGPATRAHIMALIHRATVRVRSGVQMEHALRGLVKAIAVLEDPAAEVEVMYAAYISTLRDRQSPSSAVTALLKATQHVIEHAEDQAGVVKTLLNGLAVTPIGWPPPRPAWLWP